MSPHHDFHTTESQNKKSLQAHSNKLTGIDNDGVSQIFFKSRFIDDNEHTLTYFAHAAKTFNATNAEIKELKIALQNKPYRETTSTKKYYSDEDLYSCLTQSEHIRNFCNRQKLNNWQEIIAYLVWRET